MYRNVAPKTTNSYLLARQLKSNRSNAAQTGWMTKNRKH